MDKKPRGIKPFIGYLVILTLIISIISLYRASSLYGQTTATKEVSFSEFVGALKSKSISELSITEGSEKYTATLKDGTKIIAYAPTSYDMAVISEKYIIPQIAEGSLVVKTQPDSILPAILSWIPTVLMIALMFFLVRMMMSGGQGGGVMKFAKSRAKISEENKITFADVAGLEEEKQELSEIVDFLKNPKKYHELGARIPKGVLLVGPPGTGKTFISKAVAGEADVPFFSISGSDFVEMFVGVGASRVRDLFEEAKKNAPCIVFIDEIDAVGRRRGAGIGGGNDEREQTLNQLLVEMDGFAENQGIIILAATNRPDVLDPAILRPGRFDREVTIGTPDIKGREEVFKIYAKNKPIDENIDLHTLAKRTPGFTPADIENMMNEAALLTARRNGSIIHMDDLEEAITRVIAGPKKKSRVMSEKERRLTAYHEAGHAVLSRVIPGYDPVHQVTIMPRGMAGGFTMNLPEEDKYYTTKTEMINDIIVLLGGRIAESVVLDDISTGASSDLERATKTAHDMVVKYGMTEAIGPVNYSDADEVFLGRDFTSKQNFSEELAAKIDTEVRKILDDCFAKGRQMMIENREKLDAVAQALLELETLDKDEFEAVFTGEKTIEQIKTDMAETMRVRKEREDKEAEERAKREAEEAEKEQKLIEEEIKANIKKAGTTVYFDKSGKPIFMNNEMPTEKAAEQPAEATEKAAEQPVEAAEKAAEQPAEAADGDGSADQSAEHPDKNPEELTNGETEEKTDDEKLS